MTPIQDILHKHTLALINKYNLEFMKATQFTLKAVLMEDVAPRSYVSKVTNETVNVARELKMYQPGVQGSDFIFISDVPADVKVEEGNEYSIVITEKLFNKKDGGMFIKYSFVSLQA